MTLQIAALRVVQRYQDLSDEYGCNNYTTYELQWQDEMYGDWHTVPIVYVKEGEDIPE